MLRRVFAPLHLYLFFFILANPSTQAQTSSAGQNLGAERQDRIAQYIDDERRIVLRGQRHPLATPDHESGVAAPGYRMERMILTLAGGPPERAG